MKSYNRWIQVSIVIALLSGFGFWKFTSRTTDSPGVSREILKIKQRFLLGAPEYTVDLGSVLESKKVKELMDFESALPHTHLYPFLEIAKLSHYADDCKPGNIPSKGDPALKKAWIWHRFLCGETKTLPKGFFAAAPYMHPSGKSFAALAESLGKEKFSNSDFFHLSETLGKEGVSLSQWDAVMKGSSFSLGSEFVLFSKETARDSGSQTIAVYPREVWDRFVAKENFSPSLKLGDEFCASHEDGLCWKERKRTRNTWFQVFFGGLSVASLVFTIFLLWLKRSRSKSEKEEAAERLFSLQMLTHELRTPATSLNLLAEVLRREFDHFPSTSQKAFLGICEELSRLDRLIQASADYLSSEKKSSLGKPEITDLHSCIERVLVRYPGVIFTPHTSSPKMEIDPYWFELCLKNLIENAITHGKTPVKVYVTENENKIGVHVEDQGEIGAKTLEELCAPFRKSKTSPGIGLGLTIVERILKSMGGDRKARLLLKTKPTTFSLLFEENK